MKTNQKAGGKLRLNRETLLSLRVNTHLRGGGGGGVLRDHVLGLLLSAPSAPPVDAGRGVRAACTSLGREPGPRPLPRAGPGPLLGAVGHRGRVGACHDLDQSLHAVRAGYFDSPRHIARVLTSIDPSASTLPRSGSTFFRAVWYPSSPRKSKRSLRRIDRKAGCPPHVGQTDDAQSPRLGVPMAARWTLRHVPVAHADDGAG